MAVSETAPRLEWGEQDIKGPVHTYRERLMLGWLQRYVRQGTVLDAGFGTGSLMMALAEKGLRVCGVERSAPGVRWLARKAAARGDLPTLGATQGDVEWLPFAGDTFDAVVCGEVLEHLADDGRAVAGFGRVLKRGGVCVITVPAHPRLWSCCDEYAGHYRRYTVESLVGLFESHGFRVLSIGNWGFPLIRLYQSLLFRPYLSRRQKAQAAAPAARPARHSSRWLDAAMSFAGVLFSVDNLFLWGRWGVGFILAAEKATE